MCPPYALCHSHHSCLQQGPVPVAPVAPVAQVSMQHLVHACGASQEAGAEGNISRKTARLHLCRLKLHFVCGCDFSPWVQFLTPKSSVWMQPAVSSLSQVSKLCLSNLSPVTADVPPAPVTLPQPSLPQCYSECVTCVYAFNSHTFHPYPGLVGGTCYYHSCFTSEKAETPRLSYWSKVTTNEDSSWAGWLQSTYLTPY